LDLLQTVILGLVQGFTEFLPISSSGHLVIVGRLLGRGAEDRGAALEAVLHVGTLLPVLWFFREEVGGILGALVRPVRWRAAAAEDPGAEALRFCFVATATTAVLAFPLIPVLEGLFASAWIAGVGLGVTTAILVVSRRFTGRDAVAVGFLQAVAVGAAQALAIVPGISRSGATIVCGLAVGVPLARVGAYSFLLSVPAILGGAVVELIRHPPRTEQLGVELAGLLVAAVSGYFAIRWTLAAVRRRRLSWFAPYTALLCILTLLLAG
jgi:undecaprenyl-diphosphatase